MSQARSRFSIILTLCFVATLASAASCGKKDEAGKTGDSPGAKASSSSSSSPANLPTAELKSALQAIPADALGVVSVSFPMTLSDMSTGFGLLPFDPALAKEMQGALIDHSKTHLGIDASQVRSIVLFATDAKNPSGAAIVSPVQGELKGEVVTLDNVRFVVIADGGEIVAAQSGQTLIVGKKESVQAALASLSGGPSLATSDSAFAKFAAKQVVGSYFSVSADVSKLPLPKLPMTEGLSHAGLSFAGSGIHLAIHGQKETLEMLSTTAKGSLQLATNMAKQNMAESKDDFFEGSAGIMGYYMAKNLDSMLKPTIEGDLMTLDFPFESGDSAPMIFVAISGILAAVAIPAFMKYIKKSKTIEANQFLKNLYDRTRVYSMNQSKLPASVGPTPPLGSCCQQGEKCMPQMELWQHPTWQALDFALKDPHYYSYEFVSHENSFEIKAYGDLDCDGVYSTYVMSGGGKDMGGDSGTIYKENALE